MFSILYKESGERGGIKIEVKKATITTTKKRIRILNTEKRRKTRRRNDKTKSNNCNKNISTN